MSADRFNGFTQPLRSVDQAAALLKRLYLVERESMRALGAWHMRLANQELKYTTPRHSWHDSLHANTLRERVLELRYPKRDVDTGHDEGLLLFLAELTRAQSDAEFALGVYRVVKPALLAAYQTYLANADQLDDAPSFYHIQHIIADEQKHLDEGSPLIATLPAEQLEAAEPWVNYLELFLTAIGGVLGDGDTSPIPADHPCASRPVYSVPLRASRDPRYLPATVHMPNRSPDKPREQQIWSGINHANELWAAEVPGGLMWHWPDMPWNFYLDAARWSYDEMRHSEMGMRRMRGWGFEPGVDFPMVADHYHSISEHGPLLTLALLHAFETHGPAWKQRMRGLYQELGDLSSAQDCDYDWADEAIHLRYGHTWLRHLLGPAAAERMPALIAEARGIWDTWIAERWQQGEDGYSGFMERIEARVADAEAAEAQP